MKTRIFIPAKLIKPIRLNPDDDEASNTLRECFLRFCRKGLWHFPIEDVEDVVQQAIEGFWEGQNWEVDAEILAKTASRILSNKISDAFRDRCRRLDFTYGSHVQTAESDTSDADVILNAQAPCTSACSPHIALLCKEVWRTLDEILVSLRENGREKDHESVEIFLLYARDGLTYREIAEMKGKKEASTKVAGWRGGKILRKEFERRGFVDGILEN